MVSAVEIAEAYFKLASLLLPRKALSLPWPSSWDQEKGPSPLPPGSLCITDSAPPGWTAPNQPCIPQSLGSNVSHRGDHTFFAGLGVVGACISSTWHLSILSEGRCIRQPTLRLQKLAQGVRSREHGRGGVPETISEPQASHGEVSRVISPLPAAAAK